jgi:hypothetical protein
VAFKSKSIVNPISGVAVKFILTGKDTDGNLLELEAAYAQHSTNPVARDHSFPGRRFYNLARATWTLG